MFSELATALAGRNIRVFPCGSNKQPLVAGGFNAATTDPAIVAEWGALFPDALVGTPTGGTTFVLDVDRDDAKGLDGFATLQAKGWQMPPTRTHRTRRGGAHYFFRVPKGRTVRCSAGVIGPGIDIRGDGGYVIRWDLHGGAVEHEGTVANAPEWLLNALDEPRRRVTPQEGPTMVSAPADINADLGDNDASLGLTSEQIGACLAVLDPDMGHDKWLHVGMALHHETQGQGFAYWNDWSAKTKGDKYPGEHQLMTRWDSFAVYTGQRVTARSLVKMANAAGASVSSLKAAGGALEDQSTIARLTELSAIEYDRVRIAEAERLGVRVTTLDAQVAEARGEFAPEQEGPFEDVEPWGEPVDGNLLLLEMVKTLRRFIICDVENLAAAALWCAATWLADDANVCPILLINAPEKACGKTQLLTVVGKLVPRPAQAAGITPAVLFRMIEKFHPTLLVDEIETVLTKEAEDLRGLFNAGHTRDSAFVWRSVGDDHEPTRFSVFGFKAIAGINADRLAETVTSRSIVAHMRRKLPHESAERLRHAPADLFDNLRRKLARWAKDHSAEMRTARPDQPDDLSDREQDCWEPLFAVADMAGGNWSKVARTAALKLSAAGKDTSQSMGSLLLSDIRDVFAAKDLTRMSTTDLIRGLCGDEEAPWPTYSRGQPLSPRHLATLLGKYGIKATSVRTGTGHTPKGYKIEQFEDAFRRYLPPETVPENAATPQQK